MELLVILGIAVLVGAVLVFRKRNGKRHDTSLSTGNPSGNDDD
ncbi:LPXTG cell wall anchor domain-containing protein [Nocardia sp. NPDC006044]